MFIAFFKKLLGALLITMGFFLLGYWLWPSGVFQIPLSELTIGKLAWGTLSLCVWVGGFRYLGNEVVELEKQLSKIEDAEKDAEKIVIECPYCTRKMKILVGRRIQITCPDPACRKVFKYGSKTERKSFGSYVGDCVFTVVMIFFVYCAVMGGIEYSNRPDVQNHVTEAYKPAPARPMFDCKKYHNAKPVCAPASDFNSCMNRLGINDPHWYSMICPVP